MSMLIMPSRFGTSGSWTPANLAIPPAIWLNETNEVDDGTGLCAAWGDTSGTGKSFQNSTSSQRPAIVANGLNGLPVVTFDGSSEWLSGSTGCQALTNNAAALASFVVANPMPVSGSAIARLLLFSVGIQGNTSSRAAITLTNNTVTAVQRRLDTDGGKSAAIAYTAKAWHLFASQHDWMAQTVSARLDGADSPTTTSTGQGSGNTSATNSTQAEIGGDISAGQYCATSVAEVIVLGYIPTTTDRQKIEGYLAFRWGLQANLPADHPYKTSPP